MASGEVALQGYAAAIAPEIDRIRIAISRAAVARIGAGSLALAVPAGTAPVFGMLRNLAPDRMATRDALDVVFVYQQRDATEAALAELGRAGLINLSDHSVSLTDTGVAAADAMFAITADVVTEMWSDADVDFEPLLAITGRAIASVDASHGAFSVMVPMYEPAGIPVATRFAESLTPLRFFRFDAHVAAWRGAGLTVEEVTALEDGPRKDAIEADTDRRAGLIYAALADNEREMLLDALRAVPTPTT